MQNGVRSKRIISVRTPVVLYEKTKLNESFSKDTEADDVKDLFKQVNNSVNLPKQLRTYHKFENLKQISKSALPKSSNLTKKSKISATKSSARAIKSSQHFIELKTTKFPNESPSEINNRSSYFQEILDRISLRLKKYKNHKKTDEQTKINKLNQVQIISQNSSIDKSRKRFRSVYGNRSKGFNFF